MISTSIFTACLLESLRPRTATKPIRPVTREEPEPAGTPPRMYPRPTVSAWPSAADLLEKGARIEVDQVILEQVAKLSNALLQQCQREDLE